MRLTDAEKASHKSELSGLLPESLKNCGTGGKHHAIGVLGCGDIYQKHFRRLFDHCGVKRYLFDPNLKQILTPGALEKPVEGLDAMPHEIDFLLVTSPAHKHAEGILWGLRHRIPVIVEKPVVASSADLAAIDAELAKGKAPLYCVDWAIEHGKSLLMALGKPVPFPETVVVDDPEHHFAQFDTHYIKRIEAQHVTTQRLQDIKAATPHGLAWLENTSQGGGMLFNNGVHLLNLLGTMGFKTKDINNVSFGAESPVPGIYRRLGREQGPDKTAELYVRAEMTLKSDHQNKIPLMLEAGWNGREQDALIEMEDRKGNILRWQLYPDKLEMRDRKGNILASAHNTGVDCYACVVEEAKQHFASGKKTGLYYPEHRAMIGTMETMQQLGRTQQFRPDDTIKQVALERDTMQGKRREALRC